MSEHWLLRRCLPWVPSLAYMGLIWVLSSQSQPLHLPDVPLRDKIAHAIEYGILAVLNLAALRRSFALPPLRAVATSVLLTSAWGYLDELHQAFVPGRNSDLLDWGADTLGAIVGASLAAIALRRRGSERAERVRG